MNASAVSKAILALSCVGLDHRQSENLSTLIQSITDQSLFVQKASDLSMAPVYLRHLHAFNTNPLVKEALPAINESARRAALGILRHAAAQKLFVSKYLLNKQIPFLLVKGSALATQYYPINLIRFSRDIDIMMRREDIFDVVMSAIEDGYQPYPYAHLNHRAVRVHLKRNVGINLLSPEGILIELDHRLDKLHRIFRFDEVWQRRGVCVINGVSMPTLSIYDEFAYICIHHTRHLWSRLIWLCDLDAMIRSRRFDKDECIAHAETLGIDSTVRACLEMYEYVSHVCFPNNTVEISREAKDLVDCLVESVEHGPESEFSRRRKNPYPDFALLWQVPEKYPARWKIRIRTFVNKFKAGPNDYKFLPLPAPLHFLYLIIRPIRVSSLFVIGRMRKIKTIGASL